MKCSIVLILLSLTAFSQDFKDRGEVVYQYKNEPFQYDSGVAISDRQYQFLIRQEDLAFAGNFIDMSIESPPEVIVKEKRKRVKGEGKIWIWFSSGAGSALLAWAATTLIKK